MVGLSLDGSVVSWYRRLAGGMVGWMVGRLVEYIDTWLWDGWLDGWFHQGILLQGDKWRWKTDCS
jgi:hypothetical protein